MTNSSLLRIFPVPASIYFRRSYVENKKLAFIDSIYDSNGVNNKTISAFSSLTPPETTSSTYPSTETTTIYETGSSTSASTTGKPNVSLFSHLEIFILTFFCFFRQVASDRAAHKTKRIRRTKRFIRG
jgi:hypothetical protein